MSSLKANGELTERVLTFIRLYPSPDKRVTKRTIAYYLNLPYSNSHNNAVDRQIRDAELRKQGHPICSNAGKSGYWYDPQSVEIVIADYESRIIDMSETVRALRHGVQESRQLELV